MDPLSLIALIAPLFVDGGKALIHKYLSPDVFKAGNIDEYIKMRTFDLEMFKAMNQAGGANPSYPWVEAIVRLMRPTVAVATVLTWVICKLYAIDAPQVDSFAQAVAFYLFGDRTLFYSQKAVTATTLQKG